MNRGIPADFVPFVIPQRIPCDFSRIILFESFPEISSSFSSGLLWNINLEFEFVQKFHQKFHQGYITAPKKFQQNKPPICLTGIVLFIFLFITLQIFLELL